jgi:hypothetical protein
MAANLLPEWFAEVAADAVVIRPDDVIAEARGNWCTFGLDEDQRTAATQAAVEEFVRAVVSARSRWLAERGAGPMLFYCWYDGQTEQLGFSLVSAGHSVLPFECQIETVADLAVVVRDFLRAATEAPPVPLPVWVATVP